MDATVGIHARARTWWTILRICLEERLVYRGDFALGTLMRFLPIVTQVFLWTAIFQAAASETSSDTSSGTTETIAGYNNNEIIAYYLLAMLGRAFSSMPGLASGIARTIRDGTIKKYITQPVDMIGFLLLSRIAHKAVYYGVAAGPFAIVFILGRGYFSGWPSAVTIAAFVASLIMAFLLGFFLEIAIGMIGFWFLEVSSLLFVYMLFTFFFSGHMFPIDMLPGWWATIVQIVPLHYLAYFPAAVFLEKIQGEQLAIGLAIEVAWIVFFFFVSRMAFQRGLKRYSAFGG